MSANLSLENRPVALALGEIPSAAGHIIPARVTNPGAAFVTLWPLATQYPWLAAAEVLEAVSSSANDNAAGAGARSLYIAGLLSDYTEAEETLPMHATDGTIPVPTTKAWLRIRKVSVVSAGTTGTNEGNISLRRVGTPTDILGYISLGDGHTMQGVVSIPAAKKGLLYDPHLSWGNTASVRLRVREFGGAWQSRAYYDALVMSGQPGALALPRVFPAKTDIMLGALATAATISADFQIVFVDAP